MANKVKVVFPGGRVAWLDYKIAHTRTIVRMGGRVVETEPIPVVPKVYAKPITEPIVDPVADPDEEFAEVDFTAAPPQRRKRTGKEADGPSQKSKSLTHGS